MSSAVLPALHIFDFKTFELIGTLQAWFQTPGERAKGFLLRTPQGDYRIKLSKSAWQLLPKFPSLPGVGTPLRVLGKCKQKDGKFKLKAEQLLLLHPDCRLGVKPEILAKPSQPAKILICQKSDCCRRGGTAVKQAMLTHLEKCGLADQVEVKSTGCLGGCSKGPNLIVMPGKTRLNRMTPADVPLILAEHFPQSTHQAVWVTG